MPQPGTSVSRFGTGGSRFGTPISSPRRSPNTLSRTTDSKMAPIKWTKGDSRTWATWANGGRVQPRNSKVRSKPTAVRETVEQKLAKKMADKGNNGKKMDG